LFQQLQKFLKGIHSHHPFWELPFGSFGVGGHGYLQVSKHTEVINNQAVFLAFNHPIGLSNVLHQGVVLKGFVWIQGRNGRIIKALHPHGGAEYVLISVVFVFEIMFNVAIKSLYSNTIGEYNTVG
jgi:hypothetical protein